MKSVMILCTALLFLCLSTVFSLLFYERNSSAADILAPNVKEVAIIDIPQEGRTEISASSFPTDNPPSDYYSDMTRNVLARLVAFPESIHLSRRAIEPVSIFLFGAGLIGLAIFTRRKFNK